MVGPASLGGLESEYDVRRRQSLGFVVAAIPCRHRSLSNAGSLLYLVSVYQDWLEWISKHVEEDATHEVGV